MSLKLAILKSGEDVIANIKEIVVGENEESQRVVGYLFHKPCSVKIKKKSDDDKSYQIAIFPWIPLTKTTEIAVTSDWVVSIVDPIETLEKMYNRDVLKNDQNFNIAEQPDSNQQD